MAGRPASISWWPDLWAEGTAGMSTLAKGAYHELLMHQAREGWIPAEEARLAKIAGLSRGDFLAVWRAGLARKFAPLNGDPRRLANERMERARREALPPEPKKGPAPAVSEGWLPGLDAPLMPPTARPERRAPRTKLERLHQASHGSLDAFCARDGVEPWLAEALRTYLETRIASGCAAGDFMCPTTERGWSLQAGMLRDLGEVATREVVDLFVAENLKRLRSAVDWWRRSKPRMASTPDAAADRDQKDHRRQESLARIQEQIERMKRR